MTIGWKEPNSDGGNPIKGYLIEKRKSPKGEWVRAMPGLVTGTHATVPNLEFGKEYEFRVAAVNDGGNGEFSRQTMPQMVKDKIGIFEIDGIDF